MIAAFLRLGFWLLLLCALMTTAAAAWGHTLPPAQPAALAWNSPLGLDIYLLDLERGWLANLTRSVIWDGGAAVSPDGRRVAYASLETGYGDVFVFDFASGTRTRLTNHDTFDGEPAWSPDGERLALVSERGGSRDLYLMNADGSNLRQLTDGPGANYAPDWSPDGERIAFTAERDGDPADIYIIDTSGRPVSRMTYHYGWDTLPAWSPDGRWLAFLSDRAGAQDIFVMPTSCLDRPEGCRLENPRQLTQWGVRTADLWWSADGQTLVFWEMTMGTPEIYTLEMNCDTQPGGCVPRQITHLNRSMATTGVPRR